MYQYFEIIPSLIIYTLLNIKLNDFKKILFRQKVFLIIICTYGFMS